MIQVHVFRKGEEVRDVPVADLSEVRTEPRILVWVDVVSATPEELAAMGEEFQLHEMALASCATRAKQRPRVEEYEGQVLLIAYAAKAVGEGRPVELHELDMIAGRIEDLEEAVFEASVDVQNQIFSLRRDLIAIRRVAGPCATPWSCSSAATWACSPGSASATSGTSTATWSGSWSVEDYQDLASGALEASLAVVSNRVGVVARNLGAYAAIFAVVTMISGIYGMSFRHIPELGWRYGYGYVWALALMVVPATALWVYFKRKDWL